MATRYEPPPPPSSSERLSGAADGGSTRAGTRRRARPPSILIVEDSELTRDLWCAAFEVAGFRVLVAASTAEGLARLRGDEPIDVVLCDYWLPDGTGEAMLREAFAAGVLRARRALLCTSYESIETSSYAPVIHQPVLPADLVARVRELLPAPSTPKVA